MKKRRPKKYNINKGIERVNAQVKLMAHEAHVSMGKLILSNDLGDQFASRYAVNKGFVEFYIHNLDTNTTVCKRYGFEEFATFCSNIETYTNEIVNATEVMIDTSFKKSEDIIYLNNKNKKILL